MNLLSKVRRAGILGLCTAGLLGGGCANYNAQSDARFVGDLVDPFGIGRAAVREVLGTGGNQGNQGNVVISQSPTFNGIPTKVYDKVYWSDPPKSAHMRIYPGKLAVYKEGVLFNAYEGNLWARVPFNSVHEIKMVKGGFLNKDAGVSLCSGAREFWFDFKGEGNRVALEEIKVFWYQNK